MIDIPRGKYLGSPRGAITLKSILSGSALWPMRRLLHPAMKMCIGPAGLAPSPLAVRKLLGR
jgi:hypothetical protein